MLRRILISAMLLFFIPLCASTQTKKYLTEKPGRWSLYNNFQKTGGEFDTYVKNVNGIAEWFHKKIPMLAKEGLIISKDSTLK